VTPPAAAAARTVQPRRTALPGRPLTPPARRRRVSGPARGLRELPRQRPAAQRPLAVALPAALESVAGHRLLDRLIAGKAWIALVAFALIGIVTLQLALLQLNTSIGRTLEREGSLQRENAALSIENSEMAAGDTVESRAGRLGMELVSSGALRFLTARPHTDPAKAAGALSSTPRPSSAGAEASAATESGASAEASQATQAGGESSTGSVGSAAAGPAAAASTPAGSAEAGASATSPQASESSSTARGEGASSAGESGSSPSSSSGASGAAAAQPAPVGAATGEATPAGGTQSGPAG
jgi:hypothetical protein